MQPTDVSLRPDAAASLPKTAFALAESNTADLHPRIEDIIDLYNRFIVDGQHADKRMARTNDSEVQGF
jgi:hypothetical protein